MAGLVTQAQVEGVRLTAGYLTAYLAAETGKRGQTLQISQIGYAGQSRTGKPLAEALRSPILGTLGFLKGDSEAYRRALEYGLNRGVRLVRFEAMQTPRDALIETVKTDDRFSDFQRVVAGTCAACEALSGEGGPHFEIHPNCECVPQPVVRGVSDRYPILSGTTLFMQKPQAEQDAAVGSEAAALIREGKAHLKDFIGHSKQEHRPDYLTQRPVGDVVT